MVIPEFPGGEKLIRHRNTKKFIEKDEVVAYISTKLESYWAHSSSVVSCADFHPVAHCTE